MKFVEISIAEFEDEIYDEYIKLFPPEEQRDWNNVKRNYENG